MSRKRVREEPCSVCKHYHDVDAGEICRECGHNPAAPAGPGPTSLPSELYPNFLYFGSYDQSSRHEMLRFFNIVHVVNLVPSSTNLFRNSFKYHNIDAWPPKYDELADLIQSWKQTQQAGMVFCMTGQSRSPAVVIYYLMRKEGIRLSDAIQMVSSKSQLVKFKQTEIDFLREAEIRIYGSSSVPPEAEG